MLKQIYLLTDYSTMIKFLRSLGNFLKKVPQIKKTGCAVMKSTHPVENLDYFIQKEAGEIFVFLHPGHFPGFDGLDLSLNVKPQIAHWEGCIWSFLF